MEKRIEIMNHTMKQLVLIGVFLASVAAVCGCSTPVGVSRVRVAKVYDQINISALTANTYSSYTSVVLSRYGMNERKFKKDPGLLVEQLHTIACHDERRDVLLALSELCLLTARKAVSDHRRAVKPVLPHGTALDTDVFADADEQVDPKQYFLGAAVYAYLFLMGEGSDPPPGAFDRRFRMACDLYNRSLANVLTFSEGKVRLKEQTFPLPVGEIELSLKKMETPWNPDDYSTIYPADSFEVHGLETRNRLPGLGVPIIAVRKRTTDKPLGGATPATVFLDVKGTVRDLDKGMCSGEISVYSLQDETEIVINNRTIPLEMDLTVPIAYSFKDPFLWSMGRKLFRLGRTLYEPGIYPVQPYQKGLIPLVLVHGTMSSPVTWTAMLNTLIGDPVIRRHYQIWLYLYDSGKPVIFSATHFRQSIEQHVSICDPSGEDSALKNIVIMGHSQGGLLSRMTVVDTGEKLFKAVTGKTIEELDLSPEEETLVRQYTVFKPLPEVRRVIFIATPHRGSILAGSFVRKLVSRLVALPGEAVQAGVDLLKISERHPVLEQIKFNMARTSVDSMSPENPGLLAIAEMPFPDHVKAHSIIAIDGDEQPPDGDDGVVAYSSAHLKGVESELVVPYGHSCHVEPLVIEEVRRILVEHLKETNTTP
jgi:pimeloyl-ACP methyl ester carboxylesterase